MPNGPRDLAQSLRLVVRCYYLASRGHGSLAIVDAAIHVADYSFARGPGRPALRTSLLEFRRTSLSTDVNLVNRVNLTFSALS
jgi:hypothetical protein